MSKRFYVALGKTVTWPDVLNSHPSSITYDDVLLVPQSETKVLSRRLADISVMFGPFKLTKPIVTAPMDTITGEVMVRKMHELGGIGFLPRGDIGENCRISKSLAKDGINCVFSVGLADSLNQAKQLKKAGAKAILVDVAHGGMQRVVEAAAEIQKRLKLFVITGNVATYRQAQVYKKYGLTIARVGVGPGGMCITRQVAGTGFPQLSAVMETSSSGLQIIADGGIKKPADMAKAIAAGADLVMIGSLLAGTEETPGEVVAGKKKARGQASEDFMKDKGLALGEFRAAEGIDTMVNVKGSAEHVVNDLVAGLRSAMSYTGASSIKEFQDKSEFVLVSDSTKIENTPHILNGH